MSEVWLSGQSQNTRKRITWPQEHVVLCRLFTKPEHCNLTKTLHLWQLANDTGSKCHTWDRLKAKTWSLGQLLVQSSSTQRHHAVTALLISSCRRRWRCCSGCSLQSFSSKRIFCLCRDSSRGEQNSIMNATSNNLQPLVANIMQERYASKSACAWKHSKKSEQKIVQLYCYAWNIAFTKNKKLLQVHSICFKHAQTGSKVTSRLSHDPTWQTYQTTPQMMLLLNGS